MQQGVRQHHWRFGDMPPVPALSPQDAGHIIGWLRGGQRRAGIIRQEDFHERFVSYQGAIMKTTIILLSALAVPGAVFAQAGAGRDAHHPPLLKVAQTATPMADGVVRKIDKDAQKMTIRHGPIPSLDMPPMTMVYRVKDPAMLDKVKAGDKIRFNADKIGGAFTVTEMEVAK